MTRTVGETVPETPGEVRRLSRVDILRKPMPLMPGKPFARAAIRMILFIFRNRILDIKGLENIHPDRGPIILAPNHNQRTEAILVPVLANFLRDGKLVRFLADWNFAMIPGVGLLYRLGDTIVLTRKSAKPKFLNALKPLYTHKVPAYERAAEALNNGESIGIFPEGTANRNSNRLLKGYSGAAKLSLTTGFPVVPVGITFPNHKSGPIRDSEPMIVEFGAPMTPPSKNPDPGASEIRDWHGKMMGEIARLSGKQWQPHTARK